VKRLTGARTLPSNFYSKVTDSLVSRFRYIVNSMVKGCIYVDTHSHAHTHTHTHTHFFLSKKM